MLSQGMVLSQRTIPFQCFSSPYNMDIIKPDSKKFPFQGCLLPALELQLTKSDSAQDI